MLLCHCTSSIWSLRMTVPCNYIINNLSMRTDLTSGYNAPSSQQVLFQLKAAVG